MELTPEYFNNKFSELSDKIESLMEINRSLVQQNLVLSQKAFGKIDNPEITSPEKKSLFYDEKELFILVSGPGTFDAKDQIKEIKGEWVGSIKSWRCKISLEELKKKFPDITELKTKPQ